MAAQTAAPTTNISQWNSSDFMQFVSSVGISGNTYNKIKQVMEHDSFEVKDIKGTPEELASLFNIHKIIAKKIRTPLYALRHQQGLNTTVNTTEHKTNNANLNNASNGNEEFCLKFRGKQGKRVTLKRLFSRNSKVSDVALAYRNEECENYKLEKIVFVSGEQVLQHDKTLSYYDITDENNLITVIFKSKGGGPSVGGPNLKSELIQNEFKDDAPAYRVATAGLNIEWKHNSRQVIGQIGFTTDKKKFPKGIFDAARHKYIRMAYCPSEKIYCPDSKSIIRYGFCNCKVEFDGELEDGTEINETKEYGNKYCYYKEGAKYSCLTMKVTPLPNSLDGLLAELDLLNV